MKTLTRFSAILFVVLFLVFWNNVNGINKIHGKEQEMEIPDTNIVSRQQVIDSKDSVISVQNTSVIPSEEYRGWASEIITWDGVSEMKPGFSYRLTIEQVEQLAESDTFFARFYCSCMASNRARSANMKNHIPGKDKK